MVILLYVSFFLLLLVLQAFFSGSEIALIAANTKSIRKSSRLSPQRIKTTLKLFKNRERLLATTLSGSTFSVVTNSMALTLLFLSLFGKEGTLFALIILVPLLLIGGEIIPRTFFQLRATTIAPLVSYPLWLASYFLYPLVIITQKVTHLILLLAGITQSKETPFVTREAFMHIFKTSKQTSDLTMGETTMIDRLSDFSQTLVKEAMIPLIEISAVEDTASLNEAIEIISTKGYSRLPVYHERIDNILGIVNSFDLLGTSQTNQSIKSLIRTVPFVPESKPIDELLVELQKKRTHLAIAVDEYGGTVGIITIEDILEEIVGDIQDEYDTTRRVYRKIGWNRYRVNARMEIDQIREQLPLTLPEGDYETLGGFLLKQFEHIPKPGETVTYQNYTFTIESSDERSIGEVRVKIDKPTTMNHTTRNGQKFDE